MADPYYRYSAFANRGVSSFPGCLSSETPTLASTYVPGPGPNELRDAASDFLEPELTPSQPRSYGLDNVMGIAVHPESAIGGVIAGSSGQGYLSPLKEPTLPRRDGSVNVTSAISDMINGRPSSLRDTDGPSVLRNESKVLFVDGLPTDCTRREVGHLFRPFIGYKDIKLIHKEPRHKGDKAMVFCFVEFVDAKCAITAMEALQGYKFDDKKPNSPALRINFAHFPLRIPSDRDEQRVGVPC
ncbi:RNA-binding protein 2-like isoform X2 [Euphorbia lathyris]|uniref:RNA-binding protein 2-like isoform X2 n=1 Tax=Euphorbia lathyris TaxID=212925 RepID=UPI0033133445